MRFPLYSRKVIVCEALWPEIGYIFWPFWQACNRAYFALWIVIGYDCVKMKLIFPWLIGWFPDELKKFLAVCVNGGQETFRRSPLKFWGFSPLEQKTRRFDLFTQTWIHVRSRSWKKLTDTSTIKVLYGDYWIRSREYFMEGGMGALCTPQHRKNK